MKTSNVIIENQTHDLPACSASTTCVTACPGVQQVLPPNARGRLLLQEVNLHLASSRCYYYIYTKPKHSNITITRSMAIIKITSRYVEDVTVIVHFLSVLF